MRNRSFHALLSGLSGSHSWAASAYAATTHVGRSGST